MIGFVILHYMLEDITKDCVASILANVTGDKHVVIVDNASPNGSGSLLRDFYEGRDDVTVLINEENEGFSRGNNVGYSWLRDNCDCDYIVVLNNDTIIEQRDFAEELASVNSVVDFDILGPDILSMRDGMHQNPKRQKGIERERIERVLARHEFRLRHPFLVTLKHTLLAPAFGLRHRLQVRSNRRGFDPGQSSINVILHGACVVFSRKYIARHGHAFYPHNFMHSESEIMHYFAQVEGLCVLYTPRLRIQHFEDMSTDATHSDAVRKELFVCKCMVDSSQVLLGLIDGDPEENMLVMRDVSPVEGTPRTNQEQATTCDLRG